MSDNLLNISQAAKKLGVAAVTLRLWERQGKIKSLRTSGNQRRYSLEMLRAFQSKSQITNDKLQINNQNSNFHLNELSKPLIAPIQKQILAWTLAAITLAGGGAGIYKYTDRNGSPEHFSLSTENLGGSVLAAESITDDYRFTVNVPALFNQDLIAPNIVYGLIAGSGITLSGDAQNPTVSASGSAAFAKVKTGSTTLSATGSADLLTFVAGTGISLSADATTNKLTVTNSLNLDDVGWKDDGTIVRLTAPGDIVSVGAASGAAKLNINTDEDRDLITASQSGNLKFRLTSAGIIDTGIWNGTAIANAYLANPSLTVSAGTGLSGGGSVSLGGSVTLSNSGVLSLTGTTDQVNVSGSTGAITLSLPQSIATTSSPTFDGLTVSAGQISNTELANSAVTVTAGTGLSGGGSVALGSAVTLSLPTVTTALGGTNITSYTTGDLLYASATNVLNKLGIGSTDQILVVSGGIPAWVSNLTAPSSGAFGYWTRTGTTLSPVNASDNLSLAGNASTSGTLTFTGTAAQIGTVNMRTLTLGTATTGNIVIDSGSGSIALSDNTTFSGNIDVAGSTTLNGSFTLGDAGDTGSISTSDWTINTTGDMTGIGSITANGTLTAANINVSADADIIPVTVTGTNDLGSTALPWDNLYVTNVFPQGTSGTIGWLQRNAGTLSPLNITDDFVLGSTATASALFQISGTTGAVTTGIWNGTKISEIYGGTNQSTYTTGDILYASATNTLAKRNIGSTGQVLVVSGGVPAWIDNANVGNWQRNLGAVAPINITDDVLAGGISTASATFRVDSATGLITTASVNSASIVNASVANVDLANSSVTVTAGTGMSGGGAVSLGSSITLTNAGVTSAVGTTNQVNVSASTGAVTFSLPQSIATNSNVTFNDLSLGGTATISGALTLYSTPTIATTAKQTLTLGDSNSGNVVVTNNLSAANLSGSNTGDQTITLTGDVTGTGTGSFATTIGALKVTNAMLANSAVTVTAGTGLSGGGSVALGSSVTLSLPTVTTALGGTNITSYITGDILYSSATDTLAKLGIGGTNQVLAVSSGIPAWVDSSSLSDSTWQRLLGVVSPRNITDDLSIGGTATSSAKFLISGTTGNASSAGNLIFNTAATIATTAMQTLTLGDANTGIVDIAGSKLRTASFQMTTGAASGYTLTSDASGNSSWTNIGTDAAAGPWTLSGGVTFPDVATYNVLIGSATAADGVAPLTVSGFETGKALVILNETGDQNILVASASGANQFILSRTGVLTAAGGLTVSSGTVSLPAGEIGNTELANSSMTINSAGILTGGGAVSLGGTLTLTATEADTLASITGRGATTTTLVNLNGGIVSSGAVTGKALVILNETGDQDILAASASGVTKFVLDRTGTITTGIWGGTAIANTSLANSSVTVTAGTGMSGGGAVSLGSSITLTNAGVTSAIGTTNQVNVSASTGAVTFSLPQSIATNSNVTFNDLSLGGTATISGALTLYSTPTIATTAKQTLTLGDSNTGNVIVTNNLSAANLSGSNTGDQTITLSGDVSGSGTGAITTVIGALKVTNDMLAGSITAAKLVGTDITTVGALSTGSIASGFGSISALSATLSGNLTSGGQLQLGRFLSDPTAIGSGSMYFNTTDAKLYFYNGTIWGQVGTGSGAGSNWRISDGALSPINDTLDILVGNIASASAKFQISATTGTASSAGNLIFSTAASIGTTAKQTLTIGDTNTGNIVIDSGSGKITLSDDITASGGLTVAGATVLNGSFTLGDNGDTGSINTSDWDITTTGDMTGIGAITFDGTLTSTAGFTLNTASMTTQGAKLLSLQNASTEKFYVDKDGNLYVAGTILSGNGMGMLMTNKSGATVINRSLVVLDTTTNSSFTTTTTAYDKTGFGVVTGVGLGVTNDANGDGNCDANDICMIAIGGEVNVTLTNAATATKGDYIYTSATAGSGVSSSKLFDGLIGVVSNTSTGASGYVKMIFKVQPQVTAAASIDKNSKHNEYWLYANKYTNVGEGSDVNTNLLNRGLAFDNLADSTKTDSANTTASLDTGNKRTGLIGGQTLATSTTDNAGNTYLGSNTVNKTFLYDRTRDSSPQVQVELGIDPNWYNGVTLSVATSSAQFSQNSVIVKNPNLSTSYNGSAIKVTGNYTTNAKTIYITIKSPTTFDWTDYNGQAAAGVTITSGTAQTLGGTGVSAKFSDVKYNTGDVFKIASWFVEPASSTRGGTAKFPERSTIIATASSVDIIDADTQKLWMRFSQGTNYALGADANNDPNSVTMLNGKMYVANNGSSGALYEVDYTTSAMYRQNATNWSLADQPIAGRNTATTYNAINTSNILVNTVANDVSAAVIPNQPTQNMTVSGWGYIATSATSTLSETTTLPYKFNSNPNIVVTYAGEKNSSTAPVNLADCIGNYRIEAHGDNISPTSFTTRLSTTDAGDGNFPASRFECYTWTATGQVSPRQYVGAATDAGVTVINETDGTAYSYSDATNDNYNSVALTSAGRMYGLNETKAQLEKWRDIASNTASETNGTPDKVWDEASTPALTATAPTINTYPSLSVTEKTSTINSNNDTIYVGTNLGASVIQDNENWPTANDGSEEASGSVKYYTKDYISEEMVGDIRGMWPLSANGAISMSDASVKADTLTNNNTATAVTGIRGAGVTFNGSTQYLSCTDAACGGTSKLDYPGSGGWTVGAWVKRTTYNAEQYIITKYDNGTLNSRSYALAVTSGNKAVFTACGITTCGTNGQATSNTSIADSNWYYIVGVYDGSNVKIYINGVLENTTAYTSGIADSTANFGIGALISSGSTWASFWPGTIDEPFVTANALTANQIKNMYQVGYRALQGHATTLGGGAADTNQQLGGTTNTIGAVAPDYNNQFMYVGTNSTTLGAVSKIDLNSDTNIKTYNSSANVPAGGALLIDEDTKSLAVGYNLEAVGSATTGVKTMGVDNNATATSGNFIGKTVTTAESFTQAYLWAQYTLDSSDASNTVTVSASNDGGSNYYQCNLTNTDTSQTPTEFEYFCQFNAAGSSLKTKFALARGSTKTNTYVTRYGIAWIGSDAVAGSGGAGNGLYTNTNASVANGSYIDVAHNQNSNDVVTDAWVNLNGQWKNVSTATESGVISATNATVADGSYVEVVHNQQTSDLLADGWKYNSLTSQWEKIDTNVASASGGLITTSGAYAIHTFTATSSGSFTPNFSGVVDYLVVGGGGGGGSIGGAGGGAGGFRTGTGFAVTSQAYTVTVGNGGNGSPNDGTIKGYSGSDSVFSTITSTGGGGGGSNNTANGANGGSGGGARAGGAGGSGNTPSTSPSQGNNGAGAANDSGGGGGGATAVGGTGTGNDGGTGGAGTASSISGSAVTYAGGGGGGATSPGTPGAGGAGGGGAGSTSGTATAGTPNTGGGGGGSRTAGSGGAGGSGIVIVRYIASPFKIVQQDANTVRLYNYSGSTQNLRLDVSTQAYQIKQVDTNTVRLWNYSGATQNLRLDVITGGLGRNLGTVSLAPAAADVDAQDSVNSIWVNRTGLDGSILKLQKSGTDILKVSQAGGNAALILDQRLSGDIFTASASGTTKFTISNAGALAAVGNINSSGGSLQTNGITRIDNSGNITAAKTTTTDLALVGQASAPGSPSEGQVYFNSTDKEYYVYKNAQWSRLVADDRGSCPTGYILVPGSATFGTEDFCVMKYEAKQDADKNPVSTATGGPWVSVDWDEARVACQRDGAHLISNAEWMTIARNIESTTINDMDDDAGVQLATGHSDNAPAAAQAATAGSDPVVSGCTLTSTMENASNAYSAGVCEIRGDGSYAGDDNDKGFYGTSQAWSTTGYSAGAANKSQMRTAVLSNGQVIWDIPGNVWEWNDWQCGTSVWYTTGWVEWNNANVTDYEKYAAGPSGSLTSTNGAGQYYGCTANRNASVRGGLWGDAANAGVFTLSLNVAPSVVFTGVGFRCAR